MRSTPMWSSRSSSGGVVSELDDPSRSLSKLLLVSLIKNTKEINILLDFENKIQLNSGEMIGYNMKKLTSGVLVGERLRKSGVC